MDTTTDNNETPQRRIEDRLPAETIAWDKPGAPAVPAAPQAQSCAALRHVASMVVNAGGVSVYHTPAAARLEHGHYMLSAPGAQLAPSKIDQATPAATSGDAPTDLRDAIIFAVTGYTIGDGSHSDFNACVDEIVSAVARVERAAAPAIKSNMQKVHSASATASGDELRRAVREMTAALQEREWAEHVSSDSDAAALESAITELVGLHEQAARAAVSAATKPTAELFTVEQVQAMIAADRAQIVATKPAPLDLDALQKIADRIDARGLFNDSCDIREWIEVARSLLATKPAAAPADQSIIGKLLDGFSEIEHLWGLNEPGALVRHRDVFNLIVAIGKSAAPAAPLSAEGETK